MTDRPLQGKVIGSSVIAAVAARAARETPGILRLEPRLGHVVARLRATARNRVRRVPDSGLRTGQDGVFAAVTKGQAIIDVDVATDARFNALEVAADLQDRVRRALSRTGVPAGRINVTILAIENPAPDTHFPGR